MSDWATWAYRRWRQKTYWRWAFHNHRSLHDRRNILALMTTGVEQHCIINIYVVGMLYVYTDMGNVVFWSDDKKTLYNKWVALIGMKRWRFYQRQIDHNSHHDRNILRTKGGKRKTTKGVPVCYGYHETCAWCPCQRLYSLQKMYQRGIQQTFYGSRKGNKITQCQMQIHSKECTAASRPSNSCLCWPTFQSLKNHWDWWHSDGPTHLQG